MASRATSAALDWTAKQARILTGGGLAEQLYTAERGFAFSPQELPHFHLTQGTTHASFRQWAKSGRTCSALIGAWSRPLFSGGWEHTSDADEAVCNTQTAALFIDIRIPHSRPRLPDRQSLAECGSEELRLLARQHAFAGYTLPDDGDVWSGKLTCTRHHAIDWNYVASPRPRPNRWRVELGPPELDASGQQAPAQWKEWSHARDDHGQSYYMERWSRMAGDGQGRARSAGFRRCGTSPDAMVCLVGEHFAFATARPQARPEAAVAPATTLVGTVDEALHAGDRATAEWCLSLLAGHGWLHVDGAACQALVERATHPWHEGRRMPSLRGITAASWRGEDAGSVLPSQREAAAALGVVDFVVDDGGALWELVAPEGPWAGPGDFIGLFSSPADDVGPH